MGKLELLRQLAGSGWQNCKGITVELLEEVQQDKILCEKRTVVVSRMEKLLGHPLSIPEEDFSGIDWDRFNLHQPPIRPVKRRKIKWKI
jgi:hypothetical protein